jgi:hypothetical protein
VLGDLRQEAEVVEVVEEVKEVKEVEEVEEVEEEEEVDEVDPAEGGASSSRAPTVVCTSSSPRPSSSGSHI